MNMVYLNYSFQFPVELCSSARTQAVFSRGTSFTVDAAASHQYDNEKLLNALY